MTHRPFNVLFLCTGNTARSVLAEGILRKLGAGKFNAFSAGSQPKGVVNPFALKTLAAFGYPTDGYRSKSWDEFAGADKPQMDFIFTVCDNAAGETCPIWPGHPMTAHWGVEDPAAVEGSDIEKERAFAAAFKQLSSRISLFVSLPFEKLDALALKGRLREIGRPAVIRPAKAEDIPVITRIYAEHVLGGTASFDTVPRTQVATMERLNECKKRGWPFLVAEKAGEVLGYAYVTQFRDRPAYRYTCENSIYLRGDQRGQGLGTELLQQLVKAAELAGFRQMIAVSGGGEPASVALHEACGFTLAGRMTSVGRKKGQWLDTVYLQKALGPGDTTPPAQEPN